MPETLAEFRERVLRVTAEAEADPAAHRLRVIGLVALAYGFLLGVILLLVGATLAGAAVILLTRQIILLKFLIPMILLDIAVIGSLSVRVDPPSGSELEREDAPALFTEIDRVREALGAPRLHRTLVVPALNAAVVQHPSLGIFGGTRNYLILGLPLLQGLTRAQFASVLAHEFGHLSGRHGQFGTWIYRVRGTWSRLFGQVGDGDAGTGLFRGFFAWFAPRFSAATFVLARQQEYEADKCSVAATDATTAAAALVRLELLERRSREEFWPSVERRARIEPDPPTDVMSDQARFCALPFDGVRAALWCEEAMRRPTDVVDSHPALRDRLGALGIDGAHALAAAIAPFGRSAAEELLADRLPAVQRDMSYEWRERTNHDWKVWRQESAEREETAAALRARRDAGEALTPDEEWALLEAVVDAEGVQSASAAVYAFVASHPAHILGRWTRARLALEQGDESGLADLEELVRLDDMAIPPAGSLAYDWLQSRGRTAEADAWSERMERFEEALQRDRDERSKFDERDSLDPAGLGDDALEALRTALQGIAGVESAWIVRKRLTARPHVPLHVLVCVPGRQWRGRSRVNRQQELLQALLDHVPMPPNSLFIVTSDEALALVDRLRRYGGSPLVGR